MGYFGIAFTTVYATLAVLVTIFEKQDINKPDESNKQPKKMDPLALFLNDMTGKQPEIKNKELSEQDDVHS